MGVSVRREGGEKGEGPGLDLPCGLVLQVVDHQSVGSECAQSFLLRGDDGMDAVRRGAEFRGSQSVETEVGPR